MFGFRMGEVSCPTKYFAEASSINFRRSVQYGLGVLLTSVQFRLQKIGLGKFRIFNRKGRCLEPGVDAATTVRKLPMTERYQRPVRRLKLPKELASRAGTSLQKLGRVALLAAAGSVRHAGAGISSGARG